MSRSCYFCGDPASSSDHVPPRVFFPESKDLGQQYGDLRKQLLTLPACETHNGGLALDDEYVALMVASSVANEDIGADHFLSKFIRTLAQSPQLKAMVEATMEPCELDGTQTATVRLDQERYARVVERIARGLHYRETGKRLDGPVHIDTPCLGPASPIVAFKGTVRSYPGEVPVKWVGDPRIFEYALAVEPFYLHMKFYGGFDVLVTQPTGRDDL